MAHILTAIAPSTAQKKHIWRIWSKPLRMQVSYLKRFLHFDRFCQVVSQADVRNPTFHENSEQIHMPPLLPTICTLDRLCSSWLSIVSR